MSKKRKKRAVLWSAISIVVLAVGYIVYGYGIDYYRTYYACAGVRINYYDYPVQGIDVASHQGKINWKAVADSDIRFAFIKATEGTDFADTSFTRNQKEAKANGIQVGAYHFFRFNKDGKPQAECFIRNVKPEQMDLPPIVDIELSYGNIFSSFNKEKIRSEIFNYLRLVEKYYHLKPIIYTNGKTWQEFISSNFEDYDLWICKLCSEPQLKKWTFWQYNHKGNVAGINGEVDLNTFNGSYDQFVDYVSKNRNENKDTLNR
ncbi:MAG: lysozyme [Bacteroidales bacterium]|nr:lysozyme [Bacteroidales bacterium]